MVQIIITSGTTWTVPANWPQVNGTAKIECIGGGASAGRGAGGAGTWGGGGGGGAAYAREDRAAVLFVNFKPGDVVTIQVGAGGAAPTELSPTGHNGTQTIVKGRTGSVIVQADNGRGGPAGTAPVLSVGLGGSSSNSVGHYKKDGSAGGRFLVAYGGGRATGGGAAASPAPSTTPGPFGGYGGHTSPPGGYGNGGGAGTDGNGYSGPPLPATVGGAGGGGVPGIGGAGGTPVSPAGADGTAGSGGGGSYVGAYVDSGNTGQGKGGDGGAGTEWGTAGAGGGGGGTAYFLNGGGAGGLFGGGAGGRASALLTVGQIDAGASATGAPGVIVVTYTPDVILQPILIHNPPPPFPMVCIAPQQVCIAPGSHAAGMFYGPRANLPRPIAGWTRFVPKKT
jgi:hypothetical protein